MGIISAFYSLAQNINKAKPKDTEESGVGVMSELLPELTLDMKDEDLVELTEKWERKWNQSDVKTSWLKQSTDNENYWKGKQFNSLEIEALRPLQDNLIFQTVETYLPAATKQNPEPLVELRATEQKTEENLKYAEIIRDRLADWSDDIKLKLKLKKAGRSWLLHLVGVAKMGWDLANDRPAVKIVRPKKLIFDPDGVNDEEGYTGKYVGEYRKMEASILLKLLEGSAQPSTSPEGLNKTPTEIIKDLVKEDLGTDVQFVEWWTNEYMCWILGKSVLLKKRNPHWNYEEELPVLNPNQSEQSATPGATIPPVPTNGGSLAPVKAQNHFPTVRMPYIFLVIFNLGKGPVDETTLVTQILPQQDLTNKRLKQIDKNADGMNGGVVVSEERSGLTKEEAKGVTEALRKGGTVVIPAGAPQDAVYRLPGVALPSDVYNQLQDTRSRIYDLFGIRGITPAGIKNEDTVRGKIIVKGLDTDRIGGGITEYFEQFADDIYNWVVQMYYVYDDIFNQFKSAKLPKLKISVKEGSLLPKDATTKANQAIELTNGGKMSLIDLYKALEYPDPEEMAANVWLERNLPWLLFKDDKRVQEAMQIMQQNTKGQQKPPNESISFKDLPPEGQAQMAAQAGIRISPASAAANADANKPTPVSGSSNLPKVPQ